jgi:hypothetical protein
MMHWIRSLLCLVAIPATMRAQALGIDLVVLQLGMPLDSASGLFKTHIFRHPISGTLRSLDAVDGRLVVRVRRG